METLNFSLQVHKLSEDEVNELYTLWPEIEDPYFPKETVSIEKDVYTFIMTIDNRQYLCASSSITGNDVWYQIAQRPVPVKTKTPCGIIVMDYLSYINLAIPTELHPLLDRLHYDNQFRYNKAFENFLIENKIGYKIEYEEDFNDYYNEKS